LYRKWFESSGLSVSYDAVGSESGIQQLAAGKVDFAASDIPPGTEMSASPSDVLHFPTVLGGVVPIYSLQGLGRTLKLTPQVLAGIYSGQIRKWNDPRIYQLNHGAHLPDAEIVVVHRSDGSGTTYIWTSYLSQTSLEWKSSVGAGVRVSWPTGIEALGSDGVAEKVQSTPNAIGYVELIYAIQHELDYAAVKNVAGQFIKADLSSITAAAVNVIKSSGNDFHFSILDSPGKNSYPISTFTWLLIPTSKTSSEKRAEIADLLRWILVSGQKQCAALGYAPLPHDVVVHEMKEIETVKGSGKAE
jgi:phosphate transport system substrate-binding protein